MKIAILGVPGTNKLDLANRVASLSGFKVIGEESLKRVVDLDLAVGSFADYRTELYLAVSRCVELYEHKNDDVISTHTILDSVMYVNYRAALILASEEPTETTINRWDPTRDAITQMAIDSYDFDHTFFLPHVASEPTVLADAANRWYPKLCERTGIEYTTLPFNREEAADAILKVIV